MEGDMRDKTKHINQSQPGTLTAEMPNPIKDNGDIYTNSDCEDCSIIAPLAGKVIVANHPDLPDNHTSQLFYCSGESVTSLQINDHTVYAISLSTGEHYQFNRNNIVGALKTKLLPDDARLYLSQIRPDDECGAENHEYCGYCFLKDGRYSAGVWLRDADEAVEYAKMQAPFQHHVMVCNHDGFSVMEMTNTIQLL